ncbi:hypothetical protein FHR99_000869 [Litorivivens lipolytica]|uniref:Uncharacterized protein n=1 Tax=Litorivivens lipolytica TaxID=1524264 RepID=A0A7W4W3T3_9GAMM|nr:hypothetical protein [Litorivivens lipolytica]
MSVMMLRESNLLIRFLVGDILNPSKGGDVDKLS